MAPETPSLSSQVRFNAKSVAWLDYHVAMVIPRLTKGESMDAIVQELERIADKASKLSGLIDRNADQVEKLEKEAAK